MFTWASDDPGVGRTTWRWYRGVDGGFADPAVWRLPLPVAAWQSASTVVRDLDADARPDLLVWDGADWRWYRGVDGGFEAVSRPWALPEGIDHAPFGRLGDAAGETFEWDLRDLDGDGVPDLVVYVDDARPEVGQTVWRSWAGSATGFVGPERPWALPADGLDHWGSPRGAPWALVTLDRLPRPELVLRSEPADATVGTTLWRVWRAGPDGFVAPAEGFDLPTDYTPGFFEGVDGGLWTARDLDGDGALDLVVTESDDAAAVEPGRTEWHLHRGDRAWFDARPRSFELPPAYPVGTFAHAAGGHGPTIWGLTDVNGDDRPDVLVTSWDAGTFEGLGVRRWVAHVGVCAPQ